MHESKIIPAWDYRDKAGAVVPLKFAKIVNDKLRESAEKGLMDIEIELPRLYRQLNKKGKELRTKLATGVECAGYKCKWEDNVGGYYHEDQNDANTNSCKSDDYVPTPYIDDCDNKKTKTKPTVRTVAKIIIDARKQDRYF